MGDEINISTEPCQSCGQMPERLKSDSGRVRCSSEKCFLRSLMGWMSLRLWNETMIDLARSKKVIQSKIDSGSGAA
jgi:hypothetical protein